LYSWLSRNALRLARVRPQPDPPIGESRSIRTFRAGKNYYYLRLLRWGGGQIGAVMGILFSIGFVVWIESTFDRARAPRPRAAASPSPSPAPTNAVTPTPATSPEAGVASPAPAPLPGTRRRADRSGFDAARVRTMFERMPPGMATFFARWFIPFLVFLEYLGIVTFLILFPTTYALVRIEFEQHWYIVTDRSLRIRTGVLSLSESTMSFANIQQVEVKQGPIQRLLGLADVRVRSAGGGDSAGEDGGEEMHTGVFHSVDNAEEIRDLILARLRTFRESSVNESTEGAQSRPRAGREALDDAVEAAQELLQQTQRLRMATSSQV